MEKPEKEKIKKQVSASFLANGIDDLCMYRYEGEYIEFIVYYFRGIDNCIVKVVEKGSDEWKQFETFDDLVDYLYEWSMNIFDSASITFTVNIDCKPRPNEAAVWKSDDPKDRGLKLHNIAARTLKKFNKDVLKKQKVDEFPRKAKLSFEFSDETLSDEEKLILLEYLTQVIHGFTYLMKEGEEAKLFVEKKLNVSAIDKRFTNGRADAVIVSERFLFVYEFKTGKKEIVVPDDMEQLFLYTKAAYKEYCKDPEELFLVKAVYIQPAVEGGLRSRVWNYFQGETPLDD